MGLEKTIAAVSTALKWTGSLFLAMMMFLTALDVACRYMLNAPIAGALELVEYMMAVLIPFSVAYCAYCRAHVSVEFIMEKFPRRVRKAVYIPVSLVSLAFLGVITWQTCLYVVETFESKLTSSVLLIATYPFVIPIALGMGAFTLILLHDLLTGGPVEWRVKE
ncbi:MAG: TRAP transporter small permease [Desulfobacter sp.]|nr:MAG: TRAP transporter small permease [Desulfobacter sp.]